LCSDLAININEFTSLCTNLIRNELGIPYKVIKQISVLNNLFRKMDSQRISDIFLIFNTSGDGSMSMQEFVFCWNCWIKKIVKPRSALIVVDVQNDFISGSLSISNCPAGHNGEEVWISY
jgi:exosome complex component RRP4